MNASNSDQAADRPEPRLAEKIKAVVLDNRDRLLQEIRETGELYDLLCKWGQGEALTPAEKAAARAQLLDICKTIPALAAFLAPFGSLLLFLLIKYLPFDIRPTAFQDDAEA